MFDWEYLHDISGGNQEFEQELLQTLVESLPAHITTLKQQVELGDAEGIEREAHCIKGAFASAGATSAATFSAEIEHLARANQLQEILVWLNKLENSFQQICYFSETHCASRKI